MVAYKKFKKFGFGLLTLIFLVLLYFSFRPSTPQIQFGVRWMGEELSLIDITNLGISPVWTYSRNDIVTNYSVCYFGDSEILENHAFTTIVNDSELALVRPRTLAVVFTPRSVTHIRIKLVLVDWRGRQTVVTSEKLSVYRRISESATIDWSDGNDDSLLPLHPSSGEAGVTSDDTTKPPAD